MAHGINVMLAMADYDLHLHGKQGDELAHLLEQAEGCDCTGPMRKLAQQLRQLADDLDKIAKAMDGHDFSISADGNFITLHGENARADDALRKLARRKVGLRKAR